MKHLASCHGSIPGCSPSPSLWWRMKGTQYSILCYNMNPISMPNGSMLSIYHSLTGLHCWHWHQNHNKTQPSTKRENNSWDILYREVCCGFFSSVLTTAWISNYFPYKVWDEITYWSPNFNGRAVEVWEWISNFIRYFTVHVATYPCWDLS